MLILINCSIPDEPVDYFSDEAHFIELGLAYTTKLSEIVGLYLSGGIYVHNDDDNSIYNEIGFEFCVQDFSLTIFTGFSPKESEAYENSTFAFINTGLSASREIKISDYLSADVSTSLITNPHAKTMFLVFGFGVGF